MEIAKDELHASKEKGFITLWYVAAGYQIEDGVVIREGNPFKKSYPPMSHPELPAEIAKLHSGDEVGLLQFLEFYGELGYVRFKNRPNKQFKGDPISWIFGHAQTIRLCLEIMNALQNRDAKMIKKVLDSESFQGQSPEWTKVISGPFFEDRMVLLGEKSKESTTDQAEVLIRSIINSNIKTMFPKLTLEKEGPRLRFTFSALVEVAYWHLANTYVGGWLQRCEACGGLFQQTDQRQRYCPKGLRGESLCASRARLRRFRNAQKGKKGSKAKLSKAEKS